MNLSGVGGSTALTIAAEAGHAEIAGLLVEAGADMDLANMFRRTALMFAAQKLCGALL